MPHRIVDEELALLAQVRQRLAEHPAPRSPSEKAIVAELERIREALISGSESKDRLALEDQWERYSAVLAQLRRSREGPGVDAGSPYFAHLRLREGDRERDLCLGRATRLESGLRIVDWRNAPVSRVFYRYEQGEEYAEQMGGRLVEGRVLARRTVDIRGAELQRVESPEGSFARDPDAPDGWRQSEPVGPVLAGGEGAALRFHRRGERSRRRLGGDLRPERRRADKHLADIASLIDREQFDLITRPSSGTVVVRGSAGSGKTTVALHRIAYLAYQDQGLDSPRTLFVAFSPALRAYVSHVLPSLGVSRVRVLTYRQWAAEQRTRLFPDLPRRPRYDTPALVRRVKLHPALGTALEERIREVGGERGAEQALDDWVSLLVDAERLAAAFEREAPGALSPEALGRFVEWSRERSDELFAYLDGDGEAELDVEDDALLLRAWQLRVGPIARGRRPLRYRHVALDEVQDLAPLEVQVLLDCVDPRGSVTLAGDTQQHVLEDTGFTSWSAFLHRLGLGESELCTLRVSYRSTREIAEFARALLGDLAEDREEPPHTVRTGPPVELFQFTEHGACVALLADALRELGRLEPLASVAVLTGSAATSELYAEGLRRSEVPSVRRVERYEFSFAPGIEVTEIEQAKGLEFDYVILVDASDDSYPDTPIARRQLHVGASRAVHQLWVTTVGVVSPIVRAAIDAGGLLR